MHAVVSVLRAQGAYHEARLVALPLMVEVEALHLVQPEELGQSLLPCPLAGTGGFALDNDVDLVVQERVQLYGISFPESRHHTLRRILPPGQGRCHKEGGQ